LLRPQVKEKIKKEIQSITSIDNSQLDNELREELKQSGTSLEEIKMSIESRGETNRRNWQYSLNIRGLILYVLCMIKQEEEEGRIRNVEMSKVLQNLSENYWKEFPFLIYYKEVKELYDNEGRSDYEYFQVKHIKQIALELQNNIDTIDKEDLDYYVTKRYYEGVTWHFVSPIFHHPPFATFGVELVSPVIIKYVIHNLTFLSRYLEKEFDKTKFYIDKFSTNRCA
jgi:hypothetical protein